MHQFSPFFAFCRWHPFWLGCRARVLALLGQTRYSRSARTCFLQYPVTAVALGAESRVNGLPGVGRNHSNLGAWFLRLNPFEPAMLAQHAFCMRLASDATTWRNQGGQGLCAPSRPGRDFVIRLQGTLTYSCVSGRSQQTNKIYIYMAFHHF